MTTTMTKELKKASPNGGYIEQTEVQVGNPMAAFTSYHNDMLEHMDCVYTTESSMRSDVQQAV